jgi:hypothetical protein
MLLSEICGLVSVGRSLCVIWLIIILYLQEYSWALSTKMKYVDFSVWTFLKHGPWLRNHINHQVIVDCWTVNFPFGILSVILSTFEHFDAFLVCAVDPHFAMSWRWLKKVKASSSNGYCSSYWRNLLNSYCVRNPQRRESQSWWNY